MNYRKFAWWNTQWAYAGVRDPDVKNASITPSHDDHPFVFTGDTSKVSGTMKHIPDIPITTMATAEAVAAGGGEGHAAAGAGDRSWTSRCASAGTTTASGCCCRAT